MIAPLLERGRNRHLLAHVRDQVIDRGAQLGEGGPNLRSANRVCALRRIDDNGNWIASAVMQIREQAEARAAVERKVYDRQVEIADCKSAPRIRDRRDGNHLSIQI